MSRTDRPKILAASLGCLLAATLCLAGADQRPAPADEPITGYFRRNSLADSYDRRLSFDEYITFAMRALKQVAGFDNDLHRYDQKSDLVRSFARNLTYGDDLSRLRARIDPTELELLDDQSELTLIENERNQADCGRQLDLILAEARGLYSSFQLYSGSKQLTLLEYLDSFGSVPPSQLMMGNFACLGSHEQCASASLKLSGVATGTRYCVANFRAPSWPRSGDAKSGGQSVKLGMCLPASCNSISVLRHSGRIESLARLVRLNQVPYSSYRLAHLFCLPDEASPLRQLSWSARLFVGLLAGWLALVAVYSLKYENLRVKSLCEGRDQRQIDQRVSKAMRVFALRLSWAQLFDSNPRTFPVRCKPEVGAGQLGGSHLANLAIPEQTQIGERKLDLKTANILDTLASSGLQPAEMKPSAGGDSQRRAPAAPSHQLARPRGVELAAIDGIKVLSMIWLIGAHTMLFFIRTIANGRDFWSLLRDARFMTILAGIFPVDTFFTVTGILTAFLKFNKANGQAMAKTMYWLEAFVHRYIRFMPMYLIVFWYTRDVSEYMGSGPLWDYATADTSLRSICKRESMTVPLLFQANFKPIEQHCVKPAWYLANDYQFLLVTPIFLGLLMRSTILGYGAILASVVASVAMQFFTVYNSRDFTDFDALANFKPMFATYVLKDLWQLYVLPYNRIPPYVIGLLTGHLMYRLNRDLPTKSLADVSKSSESLASKTTNSSTSDILRYQTERRTLTYFDAIKRHICTEIWTPLLFLISIIYLPMVTRLSTLEGVQAEIGASITIALMRLTWSIAIARLIYVCGTRFLRDGSQRSESFVIGLLSSPRWKPWSKIGLSVLLIQWEIISYLAQTQTNTPNMTITFLLSVILVCIVATYLIATIIYLTIEFPLSQIEHLYIHPTLFKKRT